MTGLISGARCRKLDQFSSMVWGNPQAVLRKTGSPGVEHISVEEYFDALRFIFESALDHGKILVRDEYRIALQELQADMYSRGAYVTGQPGIGKTLFLVYLLVQLLGRKCMVAVQFMVGERLLYALFRDTVTFHFVHDMYPLDNLPVKWALSYSNDRDRSPCDVFHGSSSRIRTIQVTPPKEIHWKEWSKQAGDECYIMDVWTEEEIVNLATLLERDVERMTSLAKQWGCVPRELLRFMRMQDRRGGGDMVTLWNHLPTDLKKLPWRVVLVGDDDSVIWSVAKDWVGELFSPTDGSSMPIAWCGSLPVANDVTYRVFHDESDLDVGFNGTPTEVAE